MTTTDQARRLGDLIRHRRRELKLTQADVQKAGGPSTATQRLIESGKHTEFRASTIESLERSLRWRPGSVYNALTGGAPTEDTPELREKSRQFRETVRVVKEMDEAARRQPNRASAVAEGRIRSVGRLLSSAIHALAESDHAQAVQDLDTSAVVIRSTIAAIEELASGTPADDNSDADELSQRRLGPPLRFVDGETDDEFEQRILEEALADPAAAARTEPGYVTSGKRFDLEQAPDVDEPE